MREIFAAVPDDLPGLRDRTLLLVGFAGAFGRSELARIATEHLEECEHGPRIALPVSKGDRARHGVQVGVPYGVSELCPIRAPARRGGNRERASVLPDLSPAPPQVSWSRLDPTYAVGWQAINPREVDRVLCRPTSLIRPLPFSADRTSSQFNRPCVQAFSDELQTCNSGSGGQLTDDLGTLPLNRWRQYGGPLRPVRLFRVGPMLRVRIKPRDRCEAYPLLESLSPNNPDESRRQAYCFHRCAFANRPQ